MAFRQKTGGKFPEANDGNTPRCKVIYLQCKEVIRGVERGGIAPFSLGEVDFGKRRATAFVKGVDRSGIRFIQKNYPVLCEGTH